MNKDWLILVQKFDEASARTKFEKICERLFKTLYPKKSVRSVAINSGDGGIDIFIGEIGAEPIDVIQCKFFVSGITESQKSQIRESFKSVINSAEYETKSWTLCIINDLDLKQNIWWTSWKKNIEKTHGLPNDFINLKDGNTLLDLIKQQNLYNISFELEDSIKIDEIHDKIVKGNIVPEIQIDFRNILQNTSYALLQVKNYIEDRTNAHITRNEVQNIYDWLSADVPLNQKNVLVLKGEKGLGKSAILKDLYDKLIKEKHNVLGLKADKFYCKSITELENKIFDNQLTFDSLIKNTLEKGEGLIVLIDQIDALSLTLSSSREYIETYNKLIFKLQVYQNIRIIISSRSYDLKYDAELSIYNSDQYKKIEVNLFSIEDVKSILNSFKINCPSQKVLELIRTPNHLDIYCRIFDKNSKSEVDSISTLKDLYDNLWKKYVSPHKDLKLKELIYKIAQRMYQEQRISVGNIYEDDYYKESRYLKSNSLLVEYNKEIQFFHQTFYEYSFAKQFVDNKGSLEDFITENEQSLYVRSVIKMVIEYLRESDIKKYIETISNIMTSSSYRFHLKSLLINTLASVRNPCELEKKLVIEIIFKNVDYEDVFITSIHSISWVEFLISEGLPIVYFSIKRCDFQTEVDYIFTKRKFSNYNWSLFINTINDHPVMILDYLESIEFENKESFISNMIFYINDWSDMGLLPFFEKYIPFKKDEEEKADNHYYYEIVQKIFLHNRKYAYEKLEITIINFYEKFSFDYRFGYELSEIIEKYFKTASLETFTCLFSIYQNIVEKTKIPYFLYENTESSLYKSSKINDSNKNIIHSGEYGLEYFLQEFISKSDSTFYVAFHLNYKNSDDVFLFKIIVNKLNSNILFYKNEIFELIEILIRKNIFKGSDDDLQLQIRNMIGNVYNFFDNIQRDYIDSILINLTTTYNYWISTDENGIKKLYQKGFNKKKYLFIKAIPFDTLKSRGKLYKTYQELERKFGDLNPKIALDISGSTWSSGCPPLAESAYKNMTLKQWEKSMIKYNENQKSEIWGSGNIEEHSMAFKKCVLENCSKFYDFIESLFCNEKISERYILKGIGGLIDGSYNPAKVKKLYIKFLSLPITDNRYKSTLNHYAGYFIKNRNIDDEIVQYLSNIALNFPQKEKEYNPTLPMHDAVNSIRGSAIHELMHCYYDKNFVEIIFSTIEKVIENPLCNESVKIMILSNLAYLNSVDIERSFKIFKKLTILTSVEILKSSINTSQYFNNKFHDEMEYYFQKVIETPEMHKQSYVMIASWLLGLDKQKDLYNRFINTGKEAKLCAIDVAEEFLITKDKSGINFKALSILSEFLSETDKEFAGEYSYVILRKFSLENFTDLLPFLNKYSKTILCRKDPRYFIQYLSKCSKIYPEECLKLLQNIDFRDSPDVQDSGYYDKEPIQLILGIYSKLVSEINKNEKLINKSLNIFDDMLKHRHLRSNANQAIESLT